MRINITKKVVRMHGTLDEFAERANQALDLGRHIDDEALASRTEQSGRDPWSGTRTFEDAYNLARDGWAEGVKRIADLRETLMDRLGDVLPDTQYAYDVEGFEVDVSAFLAGEPEHMVTTTQVPGRSRHVHVAVNVSASHIVSTETMMLRGLLAAGVVDALEQMGHRVTLDVCIIGQHYKGHESASVVTMKRAEDPLDMDRVAYACAHPSMLRRLYFGVLESLDDPQLRDTLGAYRGGGYGSTTDEVQVAYPGDRPDIYIGSAQGAENMEQVLDLVLGYLRDCGALQD